jgi:hypothetical protein
VTIRVRYSCPACGLVSVNVDVPARETEDVVTWMEATVRATGADHNRRSPDCHPARLHDLMIPMTGTDRIGGPTVQ